MCMHLVVSAQSTTYMPLIHTDPLYLHGSYSCCVHISQFGDVLFAGCRSAQHAHSKHAVMCPATKWQGLSSQFSLGCAACCVCCRSCAGGCCDCSEHSLGTAACPAIKQSFCVLPVSAAGLAQAAAATVATSPPGKQKVGLML
jgi:hypothetical protein